MIDVLVDAGFTVQQCCRVLNVSSQGYYDYRRRPISPTMMRREWLTAIIREVHVASRGTYGSRRVHAELTKGRGIEASVNLVGILMHNAGIAGLPSPAKIKRIKGIPTSDDLVERTFARSALDELWVSDITEHRTRKGKVYCCCVMDTCSRRIVGWSTDFVQASARRECPRHGDQAAQGSPRRHCPRGSRGPVHLVVLHRAGEVSRADALLRLGRRRV